MDTICSFTPMMLKSKTFTTKEMISMFSLCNIYLYIATFQQHMYNEFTTDVGVRVTQSLVLCVCFVDLCL
jgi:hypothetical protein